ALPGDPGAWSIAAAGALVLFAALLQLRGTRPRSRRLRAPLLIGALAVLCAGRAAMARPIGWRVEGQPIVGHVHELRSPSDRGNGTEAWALGTEAGLLVAPRGSLAHGDLIAVDGSARRAGRARSLHRPAAPRTSSLRPRSDEIVRRPEGPAPPPANAGAIHRLRQRGIRACLAHPDPASAGLLAALVFGDRSGLTPELTDLFTRTGTRHLLALSGFHVGLLTVLLLLPLARAIAALLRQGAAATGRTARPGGALLAASMVVAFIPLSGGGAPATRAAVGLGLALVSGRLRRRPSVLNLMGVAALLELGIDPLAPTRPGTQLSYLATAALVLAAGPVARALCGPATGEPRGSGWLAPVGPTGWPRPALLVALVERLRLLYWAALSAGAVASLATLPVVWSIFGEWSPASLLATPIATPPVALLVTTGWLRLLFPLEGLDHLSSWGAAGL
ncbi:MAG: ComEC/Rec2 family competence protein, partial [Planctomycetota bacterium]